MVVVVVVMSDVDLVSMVVDQYLVPPDHMIGSAAATDLCKRIPHRHTVASYMDSTTTLPSPSYTKRS
jgi:hypothetical protein